MNSLESRKKIFLLKNKMLLILNILILTISNIYSQGATYFEYLTIDQTLVFKNII